MYGIRRTGPGRIWREMARLSEEMNQHFSTSASAKQETCCVFPPINFYEDGESFLVRAEIPGVKPEHLEINATGDTLTIKGELKAPLENVDYHIQERRHGAFGRTLTLNVPVEAEQAEATFEHGELTLIIPKSEEIRPKVIQVKSKQD